MTRWKHTIRIGDLHGAHERGELTIQQVSNRLAGRLRTKFGNIPEDWELLDILDELDDIASNETLTAEDYDDVLARLYVWGDYFKVWFDPSREKS